MFDIFFILAYNAPEKTGTVKNIHFHDGYLFFQSIPAESGHFVSTAAVLCPSGIPSVLSGIKMILSV